MDDAVAKGAEVKVGGRIGSDDGQFFQPTVLTGITPDMRIWREEVFGPVLAVVKVKDDQEVRPPGAAAVKYLCSGIWHLHSGEFWA